MASLDLTTHSAEIRRSFEKVQNGTFTPQSSRTFAYWAIYTVVAPLANAFQSSGPKPSVLKLAASGHGELEEIADEFSDGRLHFAFLRVKDPNTQLPKLVLINWCGLSVPDRIKGNYESYSRAVQNMLPKTHIQIPVRSSEDLDSEVILEKVSKSSGARYDAGSDAGAPPPTHSSRPPPPAKPIMPTHVQPASRSSRADLDGDGWGPDAPPVTRSTMEKVPSAYKPVTVKLAGLTLDNERPEVGGSYKPVGKVDIAEIRRQAKEAGTFQDDRPTATQGSYQPVGKVDIAAIRAQAKASEDYRQSNASSSSPSSNRPTPASPVSSSSRSTPASVPILQASPGAGGRLTSLPKPMVGGTKPVYGGTKAPTPASFVPPPAPVVSGTSRTYANENGKTPAQLWAEKKAREGKTVSPSVHAPELVSQLSGQKTGGSGGWKSGYTGKTWAPVQTKPVSNARIDQDEEEEHESQQEQEPIEPQSSGRVSDVRSRFNQMATPPIGGPPPLDMASKPSSSAPAPRQKSPSPVRSSSPIRIAMPVARSNEPEPEPQQTRPAPPREPSPEPEPAQAPPASSSAATSSAGGHRADVIYSYDKDEDNEIDLLEGTVVTEIQMVDDDWWMGKNHLGAVGLFPSNYVELIEGGDSSSAPAPAAAAAAPAPVRADPPPAAPAAAPVAPKGKTATAMYDYEADESNELTFPEGAKITNITFPDEDWWLGTYNGQEGLFPANYVQLDE